MNRRLRSLALFLWLLTSAACGPIQAHHSTVATYLTQQRVQIKGTIVEFQFRNPHSYIHVLAPDPQGVQQRWAIECAGTGILTRDNVTPKTLKVGDQVIVTGHPGRNPADHRLLLLEIERPRDGWKWAPPWARSTTPP
jgi:Family of unknown function (DUF6152)